MRKYDRVADEAIKAQKMGVKAPYLPSAFQWKNAITKEGVMDKLNKLASPALPPQEKETSEPPSRPSLSTLQESYAKPMGKKIIEKLISQHPKWNYAIEDGQVIDRVDP